MKVPFTLLQIILTTVSLFALCACAAADCFLIYLNIVEMNSNSFVINGVICAVLIIILGVLIFKPSLTGFVRKNSVEADPVPALSAVRTYLCFIALDAAAILSIMLFGALFSINVLIYILIAAPAVFVIGAVKYIFDVRRIGVDDNGEDPED